MEHCISNWQLHLMRICYNIYKGKSNSSSKVTKFNAKDIPIEYLPINYLKSLRIPQVFLVSSQKISHRRRNCREEMGGMNWNITTNPHVERHPLFSVYSLASLYACYSISRSIPVENENTESRTLGNFRESFRYNQSHLTVFNVNNFQLKSCCVCVW